MEVSFVELPLNETSLLTTLALFILLAAVCSIVFNKIKLPPLIGYIVAGIIIANVWDVTGENQVIVEILSDIGLVMLMFCIGLEINLKKIRKQGVFAIEVAVIQLPLMVLGGIIGGSLLGFNMVQCICLGAIISGSSTAVVMAVLKSQKRLDKEHIEMLVLITIMEDIGQVIILSMITPLIAGSSMDINEVIVMFVTIIIFMVIALLIGLRLVPRMINWVSDNVSDEVLTVFSVGLAFSMALLSIWIGLSMAIGAFLMGMMIAASRKSKDINHKIEPMRDLFMAVFFIEIGMHVSLSTLADNILLILIFYLLFASLKIGTVFLAYWVGGEASRNGFLSATGLAAMGEFAFIIASEAYNNGAGVVDNAFYSSVIGAALISMVMLPFLTKYSAQMWDKSVEKCPRPIYNACCNLNASRDRLYSQVSASTKKSRKAMYRSMTHTYINILAIVAVEIVFYLLIPAGMGWLPSNFGGSEMMWGIILMFANFLVLIVPIYHLVNNVKFLDEVVISGARRIAKREGSSKEPGAIYQKFLEFNTYMMVLAIDAAIVILVPNGIGLIYHLAVLALAAVLLLFIYLKNNRERPEEPEEPEEESH